MKLPKSISPNAIAQVIVAVFFDSVVPDDAVFGLLYQALKNDFPRMTALPLAAMPAEARRIDPQLAHQPTHMLEGELLNVSFGSNSVSVASMKEYPGWQTLQPRMRNTLALINAAGIIGKPRRFGLRYISFFEGDILPKLTLSFTINGQPVVGNGTHFKTILREKDCQMLLQVIKDMMLVGPPAKTGSIVDIDTFMTEPTAEDGLDLALDRFLEDGHTVQKRLFFSLLKQDFLDTLHPIYAD
jgi:uncharacterized protein (TIGR04255 family)